MAYAPRLYDDWMYIPYSGGLAIENNGACFFIDAPLEHLLEQRQALEDLVCLPKSKWIPDSASDYSASWRLILCLGGPLTL